MKELVIDRSRWTRGRSDSEGTYLRRATDGHMCCLGFYLESCGVPQETLTGAFYPRDRNVAPLVPDEAKWLIQTSPLFNDQVDLTLDGSTLVGTNDRKALTEGHREAEITRIFAKHAVSVRFEGE